MKKITILALLIIILILIQNKSSAPVYSTRNAEYKRTGTGYGIEGLYWQNNAPLCRNPEGCPAASYS